MSTLQKIREALIFYSQLADSAEYPHAHEALALLDTLKPLSDEELTRLALDNGEQCPACAEETLWSSWFEGYRAAEKRLLGESE